MSLWCGRRWRKVRRPNRNLATAQEGSPRTKTIMVNIQHDSKRNNWHQNSLLALHLLSQLPFWPLSVSRSAFCSPLAKRRSLSQWEIDLVRRLQTPTVSYLARSKSAVCLSRDTGITLDWGIHKSITSLELDVINIGFPFSSSHAHCLNPFLHPHSFTSFKKKHHTSSVVHICRRSASCHSMNSSTTRKPQVHCGKVPKRPASSSPNVTIHRTTNRELVRVHIHV